MLWSEIENDAKAYRAKQQETSSTLAITIQALDTKQLEAQIQAEMDGIFERFQVRDCLEAIRRDIWHEGEVEPEGTLYSDSTYSPETWFSFDNMIQLVSDPYTEIQVVKGGPQRQLRIDVFSSNSTIAVEVRPRLSEPERSKMVVSSPSVYNLLSRTESLEDYCRRKPVEIALFDTLALKRRRANGEDRFVIDPDQPNAEQEFHLALFNIVNTMRGLTSYPHEVRAWCKDRINQLPLEWQGLPHIETDDIYKWAYGVKETPRIIRRVDRAIGHKLPV